MSKDKSPTNRVPKIQYRKILYATDLSESGRHAFHHAASLSNQYGAEITVLHVIEGGPELDRRLFGYVDEELWQEIKNRNLSEARDLLVKRKRDNTAIKECVGQFCDVVQAEIPEEPDVSYSIVIRMGDPAEVIIKEAREGEYDLLILGRHGQGHGQLVSTVIGDTVCRVVRHSTVPVMIVRVP